MRLLKIKKPQVKKEVIKMPNLKHLLEELTSLDADPEDVWIPGQVFDDIVDSVDDAVEKNPKDEDEEG